MRSEQLVSAISFWHSSRKSKPVDAEERLAPVSLVMIEEIEIYILELELDKRYVGQSKNADKRIAAHFKGKGSAWTKNTGQYAS